VGKNVDKNKLRLEVAEIDSTLIKNIRFFD